MSEPAIKVDGLSKRYRIGVEEDQHDTLFGAMASWVQSPMENYRRVKRLSAFGEDEADDIIWALKDVSFEVERGEVVGVIGRNGAGKSTLLKVLSHITEPTSGYAKIHGRVSSLLEVGTGFHEELTGRENVYLNGTILGMSKAEVDRKFDEIVAFSGVEKFIDTPVKRYSSGMKVRLAFAVAAHLEPEILLIDEVLAVGDVAFQKKCIGKMEDVTQEGRTILFVSHQMRSVVDLCERVIWFENGQVRRDGPAYEVVEDYISADSHPSSNTWTRSADLEPRNEGIVFQEVSIRQGGEPRGVLAADRSGHIVMRYRVEETLDNASVFVRITDIRGTVVFTSWDTDSEALETQRKPGEYVAECQIPAHFLSPGAYNLTVGAHIHRVKVFEILDCVLHFRVSDAGFAFNSGRKGVVAPQLCWRIESESAPVSQ